MSSETPRNPDIEQVIRESLAAPAASWEWSDEDRKWSAAGAAQKYLEANSTMSSDLAHGMALKMTEEMMKEEALANQEEAPDRRRRLDRQVFGPLDLLIDLEDLS